MLLVSLKMLGCTAWGKPRLMSAESAIFCSVLSQNGNLDQNKGRGIGSLKISFILGLEFQAQSNSELISFAFEAPLN